MRGSFVHGQGLKWVHWLRNRNEYSSLNCCFSTLLVFVEAWHAFDLFLSTNVKALALWTQFSWCLKLKVVHNRVCSNGRLWHASTRHQSATHQIQFKSFPSIFIVTIQCQSYRPYIIKMNNFSSEFFNCHQSLHHSQAVSDTFRFSFFISSLSRSLTNWNATRHQLYTRHNQLVARISRLSCCDKLPQPADS